MRVRVDLALAAGIVALGIFTLVGASEISLAPGYDRVGPRFFPYLVASGLIGLGALLAVRPLKQQPLTPLCFRPLAYLGLSFLLFLILLNQAGFLIASTVQFWLVTRAFQSTRPFRDVTIAALVSATIYVAFSQGLTLSLPAGIFESLF